MINYTIKKKCHIYFSIPLTRPSSKYRVKTRTDSNQKGTPVASRKSELSKDCYIEWQISYDSSNKKNEGTLKSFYYKRNK